MCTISLIIPCVDIHIPLLFRFLGTINRFTRIPDEVLIALSPKFETIDLNEMKLSLQVQFSELNLNILVQNKVTTAAMNINMLSSMAKGNILVRCDADDVIHPQKLEIIEYVFTKYPDTQLLIHPWTNHKKRDYTLSKFTPINMKNIDDMVFTDVELHENKRDLKSEKYIEKYKKHINKKIHNGANCFTINAINNIKFIDKNYAEDKCFNYEVTKAMNNTIYLHIALVNIQQSGTWRHISKCENIHSRLYPSDTG